MQNQMQSAIYDNRDAYNKLSSKISSGQNYLPFRKPHSTQRSRHHQAERFNKCTVGDNVEYADNWKLSKFVSSKHLDVLHRSNEIAQRLTTHQPAERLGQPRN
jgi:hypothetical protein